MFGGIVTIVLVFAYAFQPVVGQFEGDFCIVQRTDAVGTCKLIYECPAAIADLRQRRRPTVCGYKGRDQIVCCASDIPTPPPTTIVTTKTISDMSISAIKCREYQSAVYETRKLWKIGGGYVERNESVCNMDATKYIVGGTETKRNEFPHMALLGYGDGEVPDWHCGGTLISERFVLTAGHCIRTQFGSPTRVALGMHRIGGDRQDQTDRTQIFDVAEAVAHPNYNQSLSTYDDIGLIRLTSAIRLTPYIRPACLPAGPEELRQQTSAVASGWGHVEFGGQRSDTLMKVKLDLYSAAECNATYVLPRIWRKLSRGVDARTQMCAGSRADNKDTCQGDSGGPLQLQHPDASVYCMYSVQGVTSFGKGCGGRDTPSIYTQVLAYVPWIEAIVWPTLG